MVRVDVQIKKTPEVSTVTSSVERAAAALNLTVSSTTTLASHPGSLHWHVKRAGETGVLEVTFAPRKPAIWISVHDNRSAPWVQKTVPSFKMTLEKLMSSTPTSLPTIEELWDFGDPEGSRNRFLDAAGAYREQHNEQYALELETQVARTFSLQRRFEQADAELDRVEPYAKFGDIVEVRLLLERGRTRNSSGEKDKALPLFTRAWELARQNGVDFLAVDAAHMVAIASGPNDSMKWNLLALETAESSADPRARKWEKSLRNNLGWTLFDLERYQEAKDSFVKCRQLSIAADDDQSLRIAQWSIAKCDRVMGDPEIALQQQLALLDKHGDGDKNIYGNEEIGECLYALGRTDEAKPYFALAGKLMSEDPWHAVNDSGRIERLLELSK